MSPPASRERVATIWLLLMCVVWGTTFFIARMGMDAIRTCPSASGVAPELSPIVLTGWRFLLAAVLFPLCFPGALRELTWEAFRAAFWISVACVAGCLTQIVGLATATPSVSAFLTSLAVLFTPAVVWIWTRAAPPKELVLAVGLAVVGLALLTDPAGGKWRIGETLSLVCAACFAVQIVMIDRFMKTAPVLGTTWLQFVVSVPMVLVVVPFFRGWRALYATDWVAEMSASRTVVWTILYLVTLGSVLALYVVNRFQKEVSATRAAVLYTLEPLFAAYFSFLFWGERFTPQMVAGGAILLAGNLVAEVSRKRETGFLTASGSR